jgi:hypothetical protein
MGSRWIWLASLLGGCTQIFDLDVPGLASPDTPADVDSDGVVDTLDNCPALANSDQVDADINGVGDACEGCVAMPLRATDDDDDDGLDDKADNCIGYAVAQPDTDGDGIGDACDARVGRDARFCVWTFRNPDPGEATDVWMSSWDLTGNFAISNSRLVHNATAQVNAATLRAAMSESMFGVAFDTKLHVDSVAVPMLLGGAMELQAPVPILYSCQLAIPATNTITLQILEDATPVRQMMISAPLPSGFDAYSRFSAIKNGTNLDLSCTIAVDLTVLSLEHTGAAPATLKMRPRVFADRVTVAWDHITAYKLGI